MNLAKAIAILQQTVTHYSAEETPNICDAIQLGIEALKREQLHRDLDIDTRFLLLPGETED